MVKVSLDNVCLSAPVLRKLEAYREFCPSLNWNELELNSVQYRSALCRHLKLPTHFSCLQKALVVRLQREVLAYPKSMFVFRHICRYYKIHAKTVRHHVESPCAASDVPYNEEKITTGAWIICIYIAWAQPIEKRVVIPFTRRGRRTNISTAMWSVVVNTSCLSSHVLEFLFCFETTLKGAVLDYSNLPHIWQMITTNEITSKCLSYLRYT